MFVAALTDKTTKEMHRELRIFVLKKMKEPLKNMVLKNIGICKDVFDRNLEEKILGTKV